MKVVTKPCEPGFTQGWQNDILGHAPHSHVMGTLNRHAYRCRGSERYEPEPTTEELILDEVRAIRRKLDAVYDTVVNPFD